MTIECPKCKFENPEETAFCGKCGTQFEAEVAYTRTLETPAEDLTTGSTFAGRYQIIEELGKGGMGKVYKVLDKEVNAKMALKLIRPEIAADERTIERFRNELKIAREVSHKNVCRMYDLNKDRGTYYITMEYVSGGDLKTFIRRAAPLSTARAISIAKQICDGLAEAHSSGIVHRDLKPNNIMIDDDGNIRIMDFGIARSVKGKGITGAGVMIGTPEYMSPEQVEAKDIDLRSDIYSLGVILYEMTTGRLPFEADSPFAVGIKHKSEVPKEPKQLNTQMPEDLNRLIMRCLEKEKESRYQSAGEVHSQLDLIDKGLPSTEKVIPKKVPLTSKEITVTFGLKKLYVPILAVAALAVLVFVIVLLLPAKKEVLAPKIENSVAVISFENLTGDEKYDVYRRSIPNLLITNLENAGFSYVVSWERMRDLLKQMGKGDAELIDSDLGFELCRREGVEALVTGSLNKAGDMFAIDLRILDVETKKHIKTANSRGQGEQSLLVSQIDELSREIAVGIGIAAQRVNDAKLRITEVTTSSIEAYNFYLKGEEEWAKLYIDDGRQSLERAVEIDPTFASAYLSLTWIYDMLENSQAREESIIKAKTYSKQATEKERMLIDATYSIVMEKDFKKGIELFKLVTEKYPKEKLGHLWLGTMYYVSGANDDAVEAFNKALALDPEYGEALNLMAYNYADKEDFETALEYFKKYAEVSPGDANPLDSMAELFFMMGRLDESIAKYKEALAVKPGFGSEWRISYIYAFKEDFPEAQKWMDQYIAIMPSPGNKAEGYFWKGFYSFWLGDKTRGLNELQKATELAGSVNNVSMIAWIDSLKGWMYYSRGEFELATKHLQNWHSFFIDYMPDFKSYFDAYYLSFLGLLEVKQERADASQSRAEEVMALLNEIPSETKDQIEVLYGLLKGEVLLAKGLAKESVAACENIPAWRLPQGGARNMNIIDYNTPFLKDVKARAYLETGDLDNAISVYERLTTFDPLQKERYLVYPLYHFRLAKLYEQKGWEGKALEQYEIFLKLWKDADPDLAEVVDAKKRLASLIK
jgi:serine/threonine protein kinase/tetratricopeptide (TPR) repeat protein